MDIRNILSKIPLSTDLKLRTYKETRKFLWKFKYDNDVYNRIVREQCLFPQNSYYGHEHWLREYSKFDDNVYGLIEHGLCYKDDISKVGWDVEWDVGNIITFGDSRYETLSTLYTDYNIVRIGPRLHYAPTDMTYLNILERQLDKRGKTMVLYPAHSLAIEAYRYDVVLFIEQAKRFAAENGIVNILVSLHPSDLLHGFENEYKKIDPNIIPVTGGTDQWNFLPRLKAILTVADVTYSNLVGTHVGYSIYMGKPHVINSSSDNQRSKFYNDYNNQTQADVLSNEKEFADAFTGADPWKISKEQYELIDYNFGLSHIKTPKELYKQLDVCRTIYRKM